MFWNVMERKREGASGRENGARMRVACPWDPSLRKPSGMSGMPAGAGARQGGGVRGRGRDGWGQRGRESNEEKSQKKK